MTVASWSLTLEHWIFYACAVFLACILQLSMLSYHCYNVYKHEIASTTESPTEEKKSSLYRITTVLTIFFMIIYCLSTSTGLIQTFDCHKGGKFLGWACLLYQTAKALMHIIFLIRLHIVYRCSTYAYNPKSLIICAIFIIITQIASGIYGSMTYIKHKYTVNVFKRKMITCTTTLDVRYIAMVLPLDLIITTGLLIAFIIPLYKLLKSMQNQHKNATQDIEQSAIKLTILTVIALISSLLSHPISVFTDSTFIYGMDIPLNMLCVMLTSSYYCKMYKILCCGAIKVCDSMNGQNLRETLSRTISRAKCVQPDIDNTVNVGMDITTDCTQVSMEEKEVEITRSDTMPNETENEGYLECVPSVPLYLHSSQSMMSTDDSLLNKTLHEVLMMPSIHETTSDNIIIDEIE